MCGRLVIIYDEKLQCFIKRYAPYWQQLSTSYNLAPSQEVPVIYRTSGSHELKEMRWWLVPSWSDGPSNKYAMFNAKAETLHKSPAFRIPFNQQRCIILASGYYEWKKVGQQKQPTYITPSSGVLAFAGLYDHWSKIDQDVWSCTIITTAAHEHIKHLHHRMPVLLNQEQIVRWLDSNTPIDELKAMLEPNLPDELKLIPVSSYVNNAKQNDERCITPIAPIEIISHQPN